MTPELNDYLEVAAKKLENKRKKLYRLFWVYKVTVIPIMALLRVAMVVLMVISIFFPPTLLWLLATFVAYVLFYFIPNPKDRYETYLKSQILPPIFKKVNPTFNYHPLGVNIASLKESGIFSKSFFSDATLVYGEDRVTGTIENVEVEFTEIQFYKDIVNYGKTLGGCLLAILLFPIMIVKGIINESNSDDLDFIEIVRDRVRFYSGLFMAADFHKDFKGQIIMIPKKLERNKDRFSDAVFGTKYKKIEVEHPKIQESYTIFCTNQQMAFYVLSPKLIDAIFEIFQKENVLPMLSFSNGKMYVTIPWKRNYFSVNIKAKINGISYFSQYINEIHSFEKIIGHFKLNERIWSKK